MFWSAGALLQLLPRKFDDDLLWRQRCRAWHPFSPSRAGPPCIRTRLDARVSKEFLHIFSANLGLLVPHLMSGIGEHDRLAIWQQAR
jgi:hypothetical protein